MSAPTEEKKAEADAGASASASAPAPAPAPAPASASSAPPSSAVVIGGGIASRLARPNILSLRPYRCARDDYSSGVLLDANENALGPATASAASASASASAAADSADSSPDPTDDKSSSLHRYPCPYQSTLKGRYASYRGGGGGINIGPDNVFVGVGSDEAIDILMRIFCAPGVDSIMTTPPTYGMYEVCANVNDVSIQKVPLTPDFDLRIPEMLDAVTETTKLMFVCSPGNPTAKAVPISDIELLASSSSYRGLVVVDEAYVDFSTKGSAVSLVGKHPNVVVLQTLSKAFGLAGIRLGFAIGPPDVIRLMNNVKAPYNVNTLTSDVALMAMDNIDKLDDNVRELLKQREVVAKRLNDLDFVVKVYPSDSNFLLFRLRRKAQEIYRTMADRGVVTRYRGNEVHCDECIRVTIGTVEENEKFLELLAETWNELNSSDAA